MFGRSQASLDELSDSMSIFNLGDEFSRPNSSRVSSKTREEIVSIVDEILESRIGEDTRVYRPPRRVPIRHRQQALSETLQEKSETANKEQSQKESS